MSYILKALKKSQQERDRSAVPTLSRLPEVQPAPGRRHWPYWAGAAALANAAVLAGLVWWLADDPDARPQAPVARSALETDGVVAAADPGRAEAAAPAPGQGPGRGPGRGTTAGLPRSAKSPAIAAAHPDFPGRPRLAAEAPASRAQADPAELLAPSGPTAPRVSAASAAAHAGREATVPAPARAELDIAPAAALARGSPAAEAAPQSELTASAKGAELMPAPAAAARPRPAPQDELPTMRELSSAMRSALPKLPISVHVYSEEASGRFVIIGREKYREGDRLERELTLEAIAPGGIVLRYQDTAFCVPTTIGKSCS